MVGYTTLERVQERMKYRSIPNTHFSPSVICLGTALFGTDVDEASAFELLDTFFEGDGNFLDTAHRRER